MAKRKSSIYLGDDSFFFEDAKITRAEVVKEKREIPQANGSIKIESTSKLKKRIHYALTTAIQKNTQSFDRKVIEKQAEAEVIEEMIAFGFGKTPEDITLTNDKEVYNRYRIAVVNRIATKIKKEVSNKFYFLKSEILEITKTTTNNYSHLEKILNDMRSENRAIVTEKKISNDYSKIYDEKMSISFITGFGHSVEIESSLFEAATTNDIIMGNNEELSFKDLPQNAKIIIQVHPDFLPYLINPHKNKYTDGFIQIFNKTLCSFSYDATEYLYKIAIEYEALNLSKKFTYIELLKRIPSNYGKKKKLNPKYTPDMHVSHKFLKNNRNEYIFEMDRSGNFIYEDDYLKTYRFFKKEVLQPAIEDLNSNSDYIVKLIEHRHKNLKNGIIEFIQFSIQKKKTNVKEYSSSFYNDIAYYITARVAVNYALNKKDGIDNLEKYALKLREALDKEGDKFFIGKNIAGIKTIEEAELRVKENANAIQKIKNFLFQNYKETSTLWFDEKLLVVLDKKDWAKRTVGQYPMLGEDAIQCWNKIESLYPGLINKEKKDASKDLTYYLPFEFFSKDEGRYLTVTASKLNIYEPEIIESISQKNKKHFKAFKNMKLKKSFFENFFVL